VGTSRRGRKTWSRPPRRCPSWGAGRARCRSGAPSAAGGARLSALGKCARPGGGSANVRDAPAGAVTCLNREAWRPAQPLTISSPCVRPTRRRTDRSHRRRTVPDLQAQAQTQHNLGRAVLRVGQLQDAEALRGNATLSTAPNAPPISHPTAATPGRSHRFAGEHRHRVHHVYRGDLSGHRSPAGRWLARWCSRHGLGVMLARTPGSVITRRSTEPRVGVKRRR